MIKEKNPAKRVIAEATVKFQQGILAIDPRIAQFIIKERMLDLSDEKVYKKWRRANYSLKDFAELFFKDLDDPDKNFKAYKGQDRIFTFMQKGATVGAVLKSSRGTGKSYGCSATIGALMCTRHCHNVMIGQNVDKAKDLLRNSKNFVKSSPFADYIDRKVDSVFKFALKVPRSWVETKPAGMGALGGHYHYGLIDEIAQINPDIWKRVIYPMFRRKGRHWIAISTPDKQQGIFWNLWKMSSTTPDRMHPFTRLEITIEDLDWLEDRVNDWNRQSNMNLTVKEYLELQREILGDTLFRQEYLGEFLPLGTGVFPEMYINRAMRIGQREMYLSSLDRVFKGEFTALGFDLGKYHSRSVICVGHRDRNNIRYLDYIRIFPRGLSYHDMIYNPEKKSEASPSYIDIVKRFRPHVACIDSTGLGDPVFEIIEKQMRVEDLTRTRMLNNKKNRKGFVFDMQSKPAIIDEVVRLLEKDMLRLPYHNNAIGRNDPGWVAQEMKKEMLAFSYTVGERNVKYHGEGETDDIVISLALMCWALKRKPYIGVRCRMA
ncbi:MAG: hypothetical protein ACXQS8_06915 [Candidatus Helarchaeales archaeon]